MGKKDKDKDKDKHSKQPKDKTQKQVPKVTSKIDNYILGAKVSHGEITKIYTSSPEFAIYETNNSGNVAYYLADDSKTLNISDLKPLIIEIDSLTETIEEKKKYAQRKSAALVECFFDRPESGKKVLESLISRIKKDRRFKSKLTYLTTAISFVIVNILIAILINMVIKDELHPMFVYFFTLATFGSFGGLISIMFKNVKVDMDIKGSRKIQILDSCSRIFIAMISSLVIFVFIKANIILGILNDLNNPYVIYAFAVIAGFSEKFIPDVINRSAENEFEQQEA